VHADALDCLQSSLALLADRAFGGGTHLALGQEWRLPIAETVAVGHLQPTLLDRLGQAERIGLHARAPRGPADARETLAEVDGGATLYLVADAYELPWVPYTRRQHMPHSFLLEPGENGYVVIDGYHNDTEWGQARPGAWALPLATIDRILASGAVTVTVRPAAPPPPRDGSGPAAAQVASVIAANAAAAGRAGDDIDRYVDALRHHADQPDAMQRLVLDIWLLGRERLLHSLWLGGHPAAALVAQHAQSWRQLAAQSYLAMRRSRRGQPMGSAVLDDVAKQLHADARLAMDLADPAAEVAAAPTPVVAPAVGRAVFAALGGALHVDEQTIRHCATLRELPGFDSFRLVDVISRIEEGLGVTLPADLPAEYLRDVDGLCRLFSDAMARAAR
jgi:acyl carrier protein